MEDLTDRVFHRYLLDLGAIVLVSVIVIGVPEYKAMLQMLQMISPQDGSVQSIVEICRKRK